jgi:hypothetical protein
MNIFLALMLVAVLLADGWTTLRCLKLGAKESNPVLLKLQSIFGGSAEFVCVTRIVGIALAAYMSTYESEGVSYLLGFLILFLSLAVWNNFRIIRKRER